MIGRHEERRLVCHARNRTARPDRSVQPRLSLSIPPSLFRAFAPQQVEHWFRWLREHPEHEFARSLCGLPPKGLVVIGRSRSLDDETRAALAHMNTNSTIQILTYDELLDRFGEHILQRVDDTRT